MCHLVDDICSLPHASRCVEVGCGSGYVITSAVCIIAARGGTCQFIATDISEPALAATRATLEAHKVGASELANATQCDCFCSR